MDDATEATTVRFEWNDSPDVSDVSRLLSRIEDSGEVTGVELEVEADGFDVPTLVGVESEAAAEDERPHLNESTKAYWAAVAIHGTGNEWTTAKELAALLGDDDVTRNNAHAYLTTLSSNRVLETRTRSTEGRGANPTEYRLIPEGATLVESLWDDADDPPEAFADSLAPVAGGE